MNVNPLIMKLKEVTGYPVAPDKYTGTADKWITFTYEDERSALDGDNNWLYEEATIQINLFTPASHDYFEDKKKIKRALIDMDFGIEYMKSWLNNSTEKETEYYRQTVFVVHMTREEE